MKTCQTMDKSSAIQKKKKKKNYEYLPDNRKK